MLGRDIGHTFLFFLSFNVLFHFHIFLKCIFMVFFVYDMNYSCKLNVILKALLRIKEKLNGAVEKSRLVLMKIGTC